MTAAGLVPMGRVTHCCANHTDRRHQLCCDPIDCTPCCPECPTCPSVRLIEEYWPGFGKHLAHQDAHDLTESRDRGASADAADALWWFDRLNPRRTVVNPPVAQLIGAHLDARLPSPKEPF